MPWRGTHIDVLIGVITVAAKKSAGAKPVSGARATKKSPAKTASAKSASKKTSATKVVKPVKAAKAVNGTAKKAATKKSAPSVTAKPVTKTATKVAVKKTTTGKAAVPTKVAVPTKAATKAATKVPPKTTLTTASKKAAGKTKTPFTRVELREFGRLIDGQLRELQAEYDVAMIALDDLQHNRLDTAGDDPADAGNKTFEREQEMSIANNRLHLITQLQRARDRVHEGSYGLCENCDKTIPKARLQAYPSATLCVDCKAREERR